MALVTLSGVVACDRGIAWEFGSWCYAELERVPHNRVGLVLGTANRLPNGAPNGYYAGRIAAAAALWHAGKVEFLLVSGDNRTSHYNEPITMRRDLIAAGVPAKCIYCDYAGFRTLDSIVRAKEVFGLTAMTIVSQRFHNERALFLARSHGIVAVAFDAGFAQPRWKLGLRESLARTQAVLDIYVLHRQPRFLGERIEIR